MQKKKYILQHFFKWSHELLLLIAKALSRVTSLWNFLYDNTYNTKWIILGHLQAGEMQIYTTAQQ